MSTTKFTKIINRILSALLLLLVTAFIFVYLSPAFNMYIVRSESMKPDLNLGDMIVTRSFKDISKDHLEPGMIITYRHGKALITHRLVSIKGDTLITRGDAAEEIDPWKVTLSDVTDLYIFKIPFIGRLVSLIGTKIGWFIAIILPSLVLVSLLVKDILREALSES